MEQPQSDSEDSEYQKVFSLKLLHKNPFRKKVLMDCQGNLGCQVFVILSI